MTHLGEEGYLRIHETQRRIRERLIEGIGAIEGLAVLGHPHALHVTFYAEDFDIFAVEEGMAARRLALDPHARAGLDLLWINMEHVESIDAISPTWPRSQRNVRSGGLTAAKPGASNYAT